MQPPSRTYIRMFVIIAVVGFLVDQVSKYAIFAHLHNEGRGGAIVVIEGHFQIEAVYLRSGELAPVPVPKDQPFYWLRTISGEHMPHLNHGALFGVGQGGNQLFLMISLVAAVAIGIWATRMGPSSDRFLMIALGLIMAGTLGNLFDRVVFGGVRDFLHCFNLNWPFLTQDGPKPGERIPIPLPWVFHDFPVFNIADCCLVCGASLLVLQAIFARPVVETPPVTTEAAAVQEATSA